MWQSRQKQNHKCYKGVSLEYLGHFVLKLNKDVIIMADGSGKIINHIVTLKY